MSWETEDRMPNLSEVIDACIRKGKQERLKRIKEQGIIVVIDEKQE